jgi:hypothetical protein
MRTRTRTLNETTDGGAFVLGVTQTPALPAYPLTFPYNPRTYVSREETMLDEEPRMQRSGTCEHTKKVRRIFSVEHAHSWWHSGLPSPPHLQPWPEWHRSWDGSAMFEMYVGANAWGDPTIAVNTVQWEDLSFAAVEQMKPNLNKEGLLLNNFVLEVSESAKRAHHDAVVRRDKSDRVIEREAEKASRRKPRRPKPTPVKPKPLPRNWPATAGKALRGIARLNLLYQFTIRPTISDLAAVFERLQNLEGTITKLIQQASVIQTRHYKCPLVNLITLPADTVRQTSPPFADAPGHITTEETRWEMRPTYHATMRFTYNAERLAGLIGTLRAQLAAFGISEILPTIWEAIPYSFVVDWFFNIGRILRSFENLLKEDLLPIQIVDFVHSVRYHYTTRIVHQQGHPPGVLLHAQVLKQVDVSYYARRAEAPRLYDTLHVRTPSLNQFLLGGSLVVGRR